MPSRTTLFLLGGQAAISATAASFVAASGGPHAKIALLLQGGPGWERYLPRYLEPWTASGMAQCWPIAPDDKGHLDVEAARQKIGQATGIFIGGGHTATYQKLYACEPIAGLIRERYTAGAGAAGIPIAGMSAGALIAPELCTLYPADAEREPLRVVPGLGLVSDVVLGVHFTERGALPELLKAMSLLRISPGWGLDEAACAVIEDGKLAQVIGRAMYEIRIDDWETGEHRIREVTQANVA